MLYLVFLACAIGIRHKMTSEGLSEIWGWDYRTFVDQIQIWGYITYFGFRHPGLGVALSPLVVLEHLWSAAYLLVMPGVALLTAALIKRMSGWIGLAVWLSFPTTWLMAGIPESFPIAQLTLVGSCYWLLNGKCVAAHWGRCAQPLISAAFAVLNAMITLTNGVKPVLGWLVAHWKELDRRGLLRGGLVVVGAALLGVGFFYVRTLVTGRGMGPGIAATLRWIPAERNPLGEIYGFFIRPVGFYQSFIVYPLVAFGIFKSIHTHRTSSLLLLTAYFSVEVLIHGVVGWGMSEPWIFAPHWIWMLPIIVSLGWRSA